MDEPELTGTAAGVPYLAVPPPTGPRADAPVVLAWHLLDAPRTERAFAAALPLDGLDAWRVHLGLPMCGSRQLPGGMEELGRLAAEDAVLRVHGPISAQAVAELGDALSALRAQLGLGDGPLGLLGGSLGAAVAQLVLAETDLPVRAAVLVSPLVRLRPTVDALARRYAVTYSWSQASSEVAARLDGVARVDELARREPAVLAVVGADDDVEGFRRPAEQLHEALVARYADPSRVGLVVVPGMGHALAEEPGLEPAPQTAAAREVDRLAVDWFRRHLPA